MFLCPFWTSPNRYFNDFSHWSHHTRIWLRLGISWYHVEGGLNWWPHWAPQSPKITEARKSPIQDEFQLYSRIPKLSMAVTNDAILALRTRTCSRRTDLSLVTYGPGRALAIVSLLAGASIVHSIYKPNLVRNGRLFPRSIFHEHMMFDGMPRPVLCSFFFFLILLLSSNSILHCMLSFVNSQDRAWARKDHWWN